MDYKNGKIYTIRSPQTNMYYIGSTASSLAKRLDFHRSQYKAKTCYYSSFEILKYDDYYIELLELYPCKDRVELNKREGELQRQHKDSCINIRVAGRTPNEYYCENREEFLEKAKQYYEDHKDKKKEYYETNKDTILEIGKIYYHNNKDKFKNYYESNKEKIKEYNKAYREAHKEKHKEYMKQYYKNKDTNHLKETDNLNL
jgi:hypothetical protein